MSVNSAAHALGTVGTVAVALSKTLQDAKSDRSIRMHHAVIGMSAMLKRAGMRTERR